MVHECERVKTLIARASTPGIKPSTSCDKEEVATSVVDIIFSIIASSLRGVNSRDERERLACLPRRPHCAAVVMYPRWAGRACDSRGRSERAASRQEEASPDFTNHRQKLHINETRPTAQAARRSPVGMCRACKGAVLIHRGNDGAGNKGRQLEWTSSEVWRSGAYRSLVLSISCSH